MSLSQRIEAEYLAAYKAKDAVRLSVLRLLKTSITNLQVERSRQALSEGDILDVVAKQAKQRMDSIDQYRAANRLDLAAREEAELAILREYMPQRMSSEELDACIAASIAETGASGPQDMGRVMQALAGGHKGRYDGREASERVRAALQAR